MERRHSGQRFPLLISTAIDVPPSSPEDCIHSKPQGIRSTTRPAAPLLSCFGSYYKSSNTTTMTDEIIGFEFMDGRIWYCPRSLLVLAEGYFEARFHNKATIPARAERTDEHGRKVYFIAHDGDLLRSTFCRFF